MVSRKIRGTSEGGRLRVTPDGTPALSVWVGGNSGGQLNLPGIVPMPFQVISSQDEWIKKRLAGKERMLALRAIAIEKGMKLMTIDEIRAESNRIRGTEDSDD